VVKEGRGGGESFSRAGASRRMKKRTDLMAREDLFSLSRWLGAGREREDQVQREGREVSNGELFCEGRKDDETCFEEEGSKESAHSFLLAARETRRVGVGVKYQRTGFRRDTLIPPSPVLQVRERERADHSDGTSFAY